MEFLKITLQILQGLSAVLLILFVLLHSPKGDGIGGIGGAAQLFSSKKGAEATLNKTTGWIAGIFYLVSFLLGSYFH
ncbi:MAG: preprotein translocase subunit SecG [Cyanobacteria bacterium]|nr:preprotein translocase subunit SecG [Cyanobacteriota bacterium]